MKTMKKECGEVMLEGMIVLIITMLMLLWVLAIGFVHYQRYLVTIVTNDAAKKIASTYYIPTTDPIIGYVDVWDIRQQSVYNFADEKSLLAVNNDRADSYVHYMMDRTNFNGVIQSSEASVKLVKDTALRSHVEITTTVKFNTPFGDFLKWAGMNPIMEYTAVSRADSTRLTDYIYTTDYIKQFGSGSWTGSKVVKMINSFFKLVFSHKYAKS